MIMDRTRFHLRPVSILLWLLPVLGAVFFAWAFLDKQDALGFGKWYSAFRSAVFAPAPSATTVHCQNDIRLEAESAPSLADQKCNDWVVFKSSQYSGSTAVFSRKSGSELVFPVDVLPGRYDIILRVWAYEKNRSDKGGKNQADVTLGNTTTSFKWRSSNAEGARDLVQTVTLTAQAGELRVRATDINQYALVLDTITVAPEQPKGLSWLACLSILAGAAGLFAGGAGWGAWCWQRLGLPNDGDPATTLVMLLALGLGLVATAVTVLGTLGWFYLGVVAAWQLVGLALGARYLWPMVAALAKSVRHGLTWGWAVAWLAVLAMLGLVAGAALAPAVGVDAQIYHLPIAKWLVAEGRFAYHPYQVIWAYPHNVSNLFAVGQLFYNDPLFRTAQLIQAGVGTLWLAAVYALGKHLFGRATGLAALVVCLGIEGVIFEMATPLADLGLAFFATAATLGLVLGMDTQEKKQASRWFVLTALLAGVAAVCKVNGPCLAIGLALCLGLWVGFHRGWRPGLLWFCLVGTLSFAVASPMYLKNWLVFENPIHPFTTFFPNRGLSAEYVKTYFASNQIINALKQCQHPFWLWPYDWVRKEFVDPLSPGPALLVGVLMIPVLGLDWLRRRWPMLLLVVVQVGFWVVMALLTRFALPWLAVVAVLACAPLSRPRLSWPGRVIGGALVVCALWVCLAMVPDLKLRWNQVVGKLPHERYLAWQFAFQAEECAPPLQGILETNWLYHEHGWKGRILLDTNLVGYADFPNVPFRYYLQANSGRDGIYRDLGCGPPAMTTAVRRVSDQALLEELTMRLGVKHVLLKKAGSVPPPAQDGTYNDPLDPGRIPQEDRLDLVLERWASAGIAHKREFLDSVLYSLDEARVARILIQSTPGPELRSPHSPEGCIARPG
jgi:hypothetical protein